MYTTEAFYAPLATPGPSHRFVARTNGQADRNGNITSADGWHLDDYRQNPVVLQMHRETLPPIGRATVAITGGQLIADVSFGEDDESQRWQALVEAGTLRAASVSWIPLRAELIRDDKGWPTGIHSHEQSLVEISMVSVPADPTALLAAALEYIRTPIEPSPGEPAPVETGDAQTAIAAFLEEHRNA